MARNGCSPSIPFDNLGGHETLWRSQPVAREGSLIPTRRTAAHGWQVLPTLGDASKLRGTGPLAIRVLSPCRDVLFADNA